jgi:hypothetical protein
MWNFNCKVNQYRSHRIPITTAVLSELTLHMLVFRLYNSWWVNSQYRAVGNETWVRTEWPGFIPDKANKERSFSPPECPPVGMKPIKACNRSRTTMTIRIQRGTSCSPVFIKPSCRHTSSVPLNLCVLSYVSFPKLIEVSIWRVYTKSCGEIFILVGMSQITPVKPSRTSYWELRK